MVIFLPNLNDIIIHDVPIILIYLTLWKNYILWMFCGHAPFLQIMMEGFICLAIFILSATMKQTFYDFSSITYIWMSFLTNKITSPT